MDLYKLRTFRTVGVVLNFNKAAKMLNCAQSTISAQIKSLEEEVGALLFRRMNRRVVLTEAGEKMLRYATRLLSLEEEALADIAGATPHSGTIRLVVPDSVAAYYFPDLIKAFSIAYPSIDVSISNCTQSSLEAALRSESVDLAFLFSDSADLLDLNSEIVFREKLVVVSHPKHAFTSKARIDARDLHSQTLLLPKAGCGYGLLLRQLINTEIATPASVIEFTGIEAIKRCVLNGTGIAVLPEISVQKEIDSGQMVQLSWIGALETSVIMIWHKDKHVSEALEKFMRLVRALPGR